MAKLLCLIVQHRDQSVDMRLIDTRQHIVEYQDRIGGSIKVRQGEEHAEAKCIEMGLAGFH
jgi:hypothetical protein